MYTKTEWRIDSVPSVIIPAHHEEKLIEKTLRGVLADGAQRGRAQVDKRLRVQRRVDAAHPPPTRTPSAREPPSHSSGGGARYR